MNASPDSSATIRLHLLGSVRLVGVPAADALLAQTRRTAVLAWLGIRQGAGFLRRDSLATMFWPEHDTASARGALRKVLHHLREALGEAAILARGDEEVRLDPAVVWCDVTALRDAHRRGAHAEALALYGAPLLDGFHANAPDFERLVATERRELAELAASLAWQLAESHDTNHDATQAGRLARSASRLGGNDERLLRKAMRLLLRNGDVAGAIALYEEFAARLRDEYDATPSVETQALAQAIRTQSPPGAP